MFRFAERDHSVVDHHAALGNTQSQVGHWSLRGTCYSILAVDQRQRLAEYGRWNSQRGDAR